MSKNTKNTFTTKRYYGVQRRHKTPLSMIVHSKLRMVFKNVKYLLILRMKHSTGIIKI